MEAYADQRGHDVTWMTAAEREAYDARLKAAVDEVARVGREYPDGIHTCAELQKSEPGRRPCTCGRCPAS